MGISEFDFPANEDAWDLEEEILYLLHDGMIETCGEDEHGDVLLRITEKGVAYINAMKAIDD